MALAAKIALCEHRTSIIMNIVVYLVVGLLAGLLLPSLTLWLLG